MRSTNKFDKNSQEVFEGDKVISCRGWSIIDGKLQPYYCIYTITVKPAHKMHNGEMHEDRDGIIFCLGDIYNFWNGPDVAKITDKEFEEIGIPENKNFFFKTYPKGILFTDQHLLGLSDADWQKELDYRDQLLLWGPKHQNLNNYSK